MIRIPGIPHSRICSFILFASMVLMCAVGYAETSVDGFRELKFGMTKEEVSALPACRSYAECLYELNDKNRYLKLTYVPDTASSATNPSGPDSTPRLAKITIDMGHYTDEWHQQLQIIMGTSYRLTHDLSEATMRSFLSEQQDELNTGYEDGQVLLKVVRRPFGNMTLKVVYQNADLAKEFIQHKQAAASSPN
jgi:hypothetical protein